MLGQTQNFFGLTKANTDDIAKLLAAKAHTRPVPPAHLGIIGKAHLFRCMEQAGGDPKTFKYERRWGKQMESPGSSSSPSASIATA
jgi:hypothetical protein